MPEGDADGLREAAPQSYQRSPEKDPDDYFPFIDLAGDDAVFDVERVVRVWFGSEGRDGELLYQIQGNRYVLVFLCSDSEKPTQGGIDRELSSRDAAVWLQVNRHVLPEPIAPVPLSDPTPDRLARLCRQWKPQGPELPEATRSSQEEDRKKFASDMADDHSRKLAATSTEAVLSVISKATAAAYELKKKGLRVTVSAVAKLAGVDRSHLYAKYPDVITLIKKMAAPDRIPRRGWRDSQGRVDAVDNDD
jgi:hypothetical protein